MHQGLHDKGGLKKVGSNAVSLAMGGPVPPTQCLTLALMLWFPLPEWKWIYLSLVTSLVITKEEAHSEPVLA